MFNLTDMLFISSPLQVLMVSLHGGEGGALQVLIGCDENKSCEIEAMVRGYQSVWTAGIGENLACVS